MGVGCCGLWVVCVNELVFEVEDLLLVPMSGRLAYLKNCTKHGRSDGVYAKGSERPLYVPFRNMKSCRIVVGVMINGQQKKWERTICLQ